MCRPVMIAAFAWLLVVSPKLTRAQGLLTREAEVSLLTVYPGDAVHAQFGHSALRVHDPLQGVDYVYNYGTFDFTDPMFIPKFVRGQLDYQLSVAPFQAVLDHYRQMDRAVVEQVLSLTPAEKDQLFRLLEINALPANRGYRYRFLANNCSTRPRDMIEAAAPGVTWGAPGRERKTFRQWLAPYLAGDRWLGLGINLVMGQPADETASDREAMFLPLPLMVAADGATIDRGGDTEPLVAQTRRLFWPPAAGQVESSWPWPAMVMWAVLLASVALTWRSWQSGCATRHEACGRWLGTAFDAAVFGVAGLAGWVVLLMWLGTLHEIIGPNWNLLWAWPTHLVVAPLLLKRSTSTWLTRALRLHFQATAVVAAVTLIVWPWLPQALPWAMWPLAAVLVVRSARLGHGKQFQVQNQPAAALDTPADARESR